MKILKTLGLVALKIVKLDPAKAALYEVAKIGVTYGIKKLVKSTKNPLDDKLAVPVINAINVSLKK